MHDRLEAIENQLSKQIQKLSIEKYNGNRSAFAKASSCSEGTVRRVFNREQRMTLFLFMKFCEALDIEPSALLKTVSLSIKIT